MSDAAFSQDNPMGTDGIEFVEFAALDPVKLGRDFEAMGFAKVAKHRSKNVFLYRQGDINFIVNAEPNSFAQQYARSRGTSLCAVALRVRDATLATCRARELGAWEVQTETGVMELRIPAFQGVGGSLIYLVDRYRDHSIYDVDFLPLEAPAVCEAGIEGIAELVQAVSPGRVKEWLDFYVHLFGFRELAESGPRSHRVVSACGKVRLRLEEAGETEGLRVVRLCAGDLDACAATLAERGVRLGEVLHSDASAPRVLHTLPESGGISFELCSTRDEGAADHG
ncbi:glyoxalase [Crenobacter sp. SG2303]|uniref:Glyoxalase n=1 Tax=Crenobacter oryzisoli TaxID=3056844 RepID=A0ABT7XMX2_9NEIS|nr:glyoxalase [Crenobacter sp. SG2303]MDN0075153.1 glyoxalase [Crenobacter sp. SG2303]